MTAALLVVGALYRERATGRLVLYMGHCVTSDGYTRYLFRAKGDEDSRHIDPADVDAV